MKITFLGGVEEVTGSRNLIETDDIKILVDCGLFQGERSIAQRNWDPFPIKPSSIDAIVLTHAHIDHTGYIPVLIKNGFKGKIYCSKGTYDLCTLLLIDSGNLQEEEAARNNRKPLYTARDAQDSLHFFQVVDDNTVLRLGTLLQITLIRSYHILGATFVIVSDGKQKLTFSGDLGRPHQLIMKAPPHLKETDFLVMESTYGDRLHETGDPIEAFGKIINETVQKKGIVLIPSFSVGRTQTMLYCLYQLKQKKAIPNIPIFLDSPLGISVTQLLCDFNDEHTLGSLCNNVVNVARATSTVKESEQIEHIKQSCIIIAGSGMANGGRVLNHLQYLISDPKNTIVFLGYQGKGTIGRELIDGAQKVKIEDTLFTVKAAIKTINTLSAHADYQEMLDWLSHFEQPPKKVFLTHGELSAAQSFKKKIEERFGWSVVIPKYLESFDLD